MGPTNKELQIIMKMRDEVTKKINTIEGRMKQFTNRVKQDWVKLAAQVFLFQKAMQGLAKVGEFIELGAKIEQQRGAFENLAKSAGASSEELIENLKAMSGQTLSTARTMELGAQAMTLGLHPSKLPRLMEISRASARAMGKEVDFMFESIVTGSARQSRQILDNLGILVKVEDATKRYAETTGILNRELTDEEKRIAFLNAVAENGEEIMKKVNIQAKSQFENIQSMKAVWDDFNKGLAEFLNKSPKVRGMIEAIATAAEFWNEKMQDALATLDQQQKNPALAHMEEQYKKIGEEIEFIKNHAETMGGIIHRDTLEINELLIQQHRILNTINRLKEEGIELNQKQLDQMNEQAVKDEENAERIKAIDEDTLRFRELIRDLDDQRRRDFESDLQGKVALLEEFHNIQTTAATSWLDLAAKSMKNFHHGMSSALSDVITGTKTASAAFSQFGQAMLKTIVDWIAQRTVAMALEMAFKSTIMATTAAMAASLAAAWAPAAALASLATLGANASAAAAGILTTAAVSQAVALTAIPRARGGDDIVRRPTLFLAGDAGPERATFTPLGGPFKGRGGGDVHLHIGPVYQQPWENINELSEKILNKTRRNRRYWGYT